MSKYYNPQRKKNMYIPGDPKPFKLSRTKISNFLECKKCFYLDRRLGVGQPPGYPFTLNLAVDALLKKEFDIYREQVRPHPLMEEYSIKAVPANHPELDVWRQNFKGIQHLHQPTNLIITGAIDDLWQGVNGEYYVVDYKATSRKDPVLELPTEYGYQEQLEIYQWLLRQKGLNVSNTGYFAYYNGRKDPKGLFGRLKFHETLITCVGDDSWIEPKLLEIHACLNSDKIPPPSNDCDYCNYREAVTGHERIETKIA